MKYEALLGRLQAQLFQGCGDGIGIEAAPGQNSGDAAGEFRCRGAGYPLAAQCSARRGEGALLVLRRRRCSVGCPLGNALVNAVVDERFHNERA